MPRIPRVHRVEARYRNGERKLRHYLTPEAAQERAARFQEGRPAQLNAEELAKHQAAGTEAGADVPLVIVTASHPITYPEPLGDEVPLETADAIVDRRQLELLAEALGLALAPIRSITLTSASSAVVTYQADPTGKHAPLQWRVAIINSEEN